MSQQAHIHFRRLALIALAAVCALAFALANVATANAADVLIRSCAQSSGELNWTPDNPGWWGNLSTAQTPGNTTGTCPDGMSFVTGGTATKNTTSAWNFRFQATESVSHVKLSYEGGDTSTGWKYTLNNCPTAECATLATFPDRAPDAAPATLEVDTPDLWQLNIRATCTATTCGPATPLKFHNIISTVHDVTPPTSIVMITHGNWMKAREFKAGVWINDNKGMGVSTFNARVDNMNGFFAEGGCSLAFLYRDSPYYPANFRCPEAVRRDYGIFDLAGVADGVHNIVVDAVDGAGNVMPTSKTQFRIDDTPPDTPRNVVLSNVNKHGWTTAPEIGATWVNPGEENETQFQSGIAHPRYTRNPHAGYSSEPITSNAFVQSYSKNILPHLDLPEDGMYDFTIATVDWADNPSGNAPFTVGRDRGIPDAPKLAASPWMNQQALNSYRQPVVADAGAAISGVCGFAVLTNSTENSTPANQTTNEMPLTSFPVDPGLADGVNWMHARSISCADNPSQPAHTAIKVDRSAPDVFVDGLPATGWTNKQITAGVSATDELSGVAKITFAIDGETPLNSPSSSTSIPMPAGTHVLKVSATDVARNTSIDQKYKLQFDGVAPEATVEAFDPARPTRLAGKVTDALSGVANAQFEYRRTGSAGGWTALPTATQVDSVGAHEMDVSAKIPDDELDDGDYLFRLRASDVAGNVTAAPPALALSLPLRSQPSLTVLLATNKVCKKGVGCKSKSKLNVKDAKETRTVPFGSAVTLTGELHDERGATMPGRVVKIYSAVGGKNKQFLDTRTTDARGAFTYAASKGPSRRFIVEYEGSPTQLPADDAADLGVLIGLTAKTSASSVHNGRAIKLSGRVRGVTAQFPATGLQVVIKYFKPGVGWKPAFDNPTVDANGKYVTTPYRFVGALTSPKTLKFKAFISTKLTGFPYIGGYSNVVEVRLLP